MRIRLNLEQDWDKVRADLKSSDVEDYLTRILRSTVASEVYKLGWERGRDATLKAMHEALGVDIPRE